MDEASGDAGRNGITGAARAYLLLRRLCHSLASAASSSTRNDFKGLRITVTIYHMRSASTPRFWADLGVVCLRASQIDAGGTTRKRGRRT